MFTLHRFSRSFGFCIFRRNFSAPVVPFASRVTPDEGKPEDHKTKDVHRSEEGLNESAAKPGVSNGGKNPIVAAAFASLRQSDRETPKKFAAWSDIDEKIINATSVNELLAVPGHVRVTRKQALKIVSILAEWSSIRKVKLTDFENDVRFVQLCSILGRANGRNNNGNKITAVSRSDVTPLHVDDLQTVLGVTANDEAAKLIAGLTMPQMIRVMVSLGQKRKRSTPLLRSLAFNISSNMSRLNLKECGDLLYAMAILNFRDSVLTARICADIEIELPKNEDKPAPVISILTSLSLLRYRDTSILDSFSDWIVSKRDICKSSHISALLLSLASLNYEPSNMDAVKINLVGSLTKSDIKSVDWLNTVWALVVLKCATTEHLSSVLCPGFLASLESERNGELTPALKMKILNLYAYAELVLKDTSITGKINVNDAKLYVPIDPSKEKRVLIAGMLDALRSLLPSENHVRINRRTPMGFAIDAECVLDSKCLPLAVDKVHPGSKRMALMVHDYHDMCQGPHPALSGVQAIACRLLEEKGYCVLSIPYNEFNTSDKLLKRIEYLQKMFKSRVSEKA
ncbi:FAST kinase domain-containing protein 4 isoform X2 [Toxorhynchites rutilus septentrionalis]|nr:FAST kinase domain-containing protein 4 isoform X2 [Toxorhynchites rutilus septentrionalis]